MWILVTKHKQILRIIQIFKRYHWIYKTCNNNILNQNSSPIQFDNLSIKNRHTNFIMKSIVKYWKDISTETHAWNIFDRKYPIPIAEKHLPRTGNKSSQTKGCTCTSEHVVRPETCEGDSVRSVQTMILPGRGELGSLARTVLRKNHVSTLCA